VTPVQGMVTGAVFAGEGHFVLDPPLDSERKSLKLLTKEDEFSENFNQAVLRFTDSTYDEIKKAGSPASAGCDAGLLRESQNTTRHKLKYNLEARILAEVLSPAQRGLFIAFIHGKHYNSKERYQIDPDSGSEQVGFMTYDENKMGDWASFNISGDHSPDAVGKPFRIEHQQLDATFEKSGKLVGKATADLVVRRKGLRVVGFRLVPAPAGAECDGKRPGAVVYSGGQERRRRFRGHLAQSSCRGKEDLDHDGVRRQRSGR